MTRAPASASSSGASKSPAGAARRRAPRASPRRGSKYPWGARATLSLAILAFVALAGCGGGDAALRAKALDLFAQGDFAAAESETIKPEVIKESQNRLLSLLELGAIAHYQGLYVKSNFYFFRAKQVARELYTTSIREQIATGIFNDNSASYVVMEYELSLLHYYIAANFLLTSQSERLPAYSIPEIRDGKNIIFSAQSGAEQVLTARDKAEALTRARAELLDWNAYLREVRERNRGQPYYKDDLLNKVFAAYIHRLVGTMPDQNIARVLLKDADEILVKAYSAYPTFNAKSEEYVEGYKKFEAMGVDAVKDRFIAKTPRYNATQAQIDGSQKAQGNVMFLLEHGLAPKRKEKSYVIGLSTLFREIKDPGLRRAVEEIGAHVLIELAPQFGLAFVGATVVGAATGKGEKGGNPEFLSEALDSAIGFEFKLPMVEYEPVNESYVIRYVREGDSREFTAPVCVLNPVGDIARLNIERRASALALKTGVRVGLKYLAALVPAVLTYKKVNGPDFVKLLAAGAVWMAGKKIVDATEAADTRAWGYLPKWIGIAESTLPPGQYRVSADRSEDKRQFPIGRLRVDASAHAVLKARILGDGNIANSPSANIIN